MESTVDTPDNNLSNSEGGAGDSRSGSDVKDPIIKKPIPVKYTFDEHMWDKLPEIQ